jgi:hypothetical protein
MASVDIPRSAALGPARLSERRSGSLARAACVIGLACAAGIPAPGWAPEAQAQTTAQAPTRARPAPPPLTVQRRSFLDLGKVPPRGSMHNYVIMDTWLREPVYWNQRGLLRLENLPQRFDPPGRPQPLFEF